jgi:hypothetical protein
MVKEKNEELREKQIFHRFLVGFAITMVALVAGSDWYPAIREIFNAYMWTVIVFSFVLIVRRRMLSKLSFWAVLTPIFCFHVITMWHENSAISKTNTWIIFIPIIVETLIIQAVIELLKQKIM